MKLPLFVPFNVRNKIIYENCTNEKDITELPTKDHCETLLSYMNEKQIFDGINKRLGKIYFSKARANFYITKSVESFKKNQITTRLNFLRGVK